MELRQLKYFVAVAEELHFRRAAERLYVAQPAVSEQIRKLEAELGVRLFDRTNRRVAITEAGAALLDEGRRVLAQADAAQLAARNARDRAGARLRIGYLPDSLPASVPRALQQLAERRSARRRVDGDRPGAAPDPAGPRPSARRGRGGPAGRDRWVARDVARTAGSGRRDRRARRPGGRAGDQPCAARSRLAWSCCRVRSTRRTTTRCSRCVATRRSRRRCSRCRSRASSPSCSRSRRAPALPSCRPR